MSRRLRARGAAATMIIFGATIVLVMFTIFSYVFGRAYSEKDRLRQRADAIVLAAAGLARLGIARSDAVALPVDACLPAAGQGIVAIEGRADDDAVRAACAALDDPSSRACLAAERAFLARLGGGCSVPAGALCTRDGDSLHMRAWWDGSGRSADLHGDAGDPAGLGARAAEEVGAA